MMTHPLRLKFIVIEMEFWVLKPDTLYRVLPFVFNLAEFFFIFYFYEKIVCLDEKTSHFLEILKWENGIFKSIS